MKDVKKSDSNPGSMECQKQKKKRKYILTYFLYGYSFFVLQINKYIQISC